MIIDQKIKIPGHKPGIKFLLALELLHTLGVFIIGVLIHINKVKRNIKVKSFFEHIFHCLEFALDHAFVLTKKLSFISIFLNCFAHNINSLVFYLVISCSP